MFCPCIENGTIFVLNSAAKYISALFIPICGPLGLASLGQPEYRREGRRVFSHPPTPRSVSKRSYNVPRFILLPPIKTYIFHVMSWSCLMCVLLLCFVFLMEHISCQERCCMPLYIYLVACQIDPPRTDSWITPPLQLKGCSETHTHCIVAAYSSYYMPEASLGL